jgi:hypothetical protein
MIITPRSTSLKNTQHLRTIPYYLGHFLIYLGCLITSLVLIWLVFKVQRIYRSYQVVAQSLTTLETMAAEGRTLSLDEFNLTQWQQSLREASGGIETLSEELTPFIALTAYLGWLPRYGGDIQALPDLLVTGRDLTQAGVSLVDILALALVPKPNSEQDITLSHLVVILAQAKAEIEQAEARLQRDQAIIREIDSEHLSPGMAYRVTWLKPYLSQAISGLQLAKELPVVLGAESPRTYLILTQNSDELRPTGGYITTAGYIVFEQGRITEFVMQDSYAVDRLAPDTPYPPEPLYRYMAADYWVLRDASWSPDFPTTARVALDLYERGQGIAAEGVIALDQQGLAYLLRAFEPLEVEGDQVTSDNVIKLIRQHWAPEPGQNLDNAWWSQRKSFMLALGEAIRHRFEHDFEVIDLPVLADAWWQAAAEKHILIYLNDPALANFLAQKNWAGSLHSTQGDYLMVADANLGFNKASALVERHLNYEITLAEDGSAQAHAHLVYQHHAQKPLERCRPEVRYNPVYEQNMERCYWNYLHLIVPTQAQLISGPKIVVEGQYLLRGQPTTGEIEVVPLDLDKTSWGQLFVLAPQKSISLDYHYTLPVGTVHSVEAHWEYSLYLQKQPGTLEPTVEVRVILPEQARLLKSQPQPLSQQARVIAYYISLKTDQQIEISYTLP